MSKKQRDQLLKTLNTTGKKYKPGFGASILSKYGWKEGQGLGKAKDGIKDPVPVKKIDGTAALGSSTKSDEWHNWWDDMYNQLAAKVQVKDHSGKEKKKTKKKENKKSK